MTILGGTNYSKKQVVRMFKSKESCIWTVRNTKGQYIGAFWAYTAQEAISKAVRADAAAGSTFRSQPASLKGATLTATREA